MNIVYVANSKIPSSQANSIHVMKMCQAFAENGHRINLLVPDYDGTSTESTLQNLFDNYSVKQVFGISRIKIRFNKGGIYLFGFLASFYYLKKQPDVVYGRSLVGCFFAALFGFKTIFEMHSLPEYGAGLSNKLNNPDK